MAPLAVWSVLALALGLGQAVQSPSMPPPHGGCKFDAPAFWGVGIGGLVQPPKAKTQVHPDTSSLPQDFNSDVVIFDARIDERGVVTSACVLRGVRADVDAAALAALKQWKFQPGYLRQPPKSAVPVVMTVTVNVRQPLK
jgi:TonB family protein